MVICVRVVVDAVMPKGTNVACLPTIDFLDSVVVTLHSRIHYRFAHPFKRMYILYPMDVFSTVFIQVGRFTSLLCLRLLVWYQ